MTIITNYAIIKDISSSIFYITKNFGLDLTKESPFRFRFKNDPWRNVKGILSAHDENKPQAVQFKTTIEGDTSGSTFDIDAIKDVRVERAGILTSIFIKGGEDAPYEVELQFMPGKDYLIKEGYHVTKSGFFDVLGSFTLEFNSKVLNSTSEMETRVDILNSKLLVDVHEFGCGISLSFESNVAENFYPNVKIDSLTEMKIISDGVKSRLSVIGRGPDKEHIQFQIFPKTDNSRNIDPLLLHTALSCITRSHYDPDKSALQDLSAIFSTAAIPESLLPNYVVSKSDPGKYYHKTITVKRKGIYFSPNQHDSELAIFKASLILAGWSDVECVEESDNIVFTFYP